MKKLLLLLIMSVTLLAQPLPIAVNDLSGTGLSDDELSIISERLRSELFKTGTFQVMERGEMQLILQEQQFQMSGACDDASCMIEVGQLLGVSKIVAGTVGKIGDFFTISIRIIDVETGQIDASADHDYTGTISGLITNGLKAVAQNLSNSERGIDQIVSESTSQTQILPSSVQINSTPDGALVQIDELKGTTPFTGSLLPGEYELTLILAGYRDFETDITIEENTDFSELFTLREGSQRKRGTITRIVSGTIAAGALGAGIYMNSKVTEYNDDAEKMQSDALQNGTGAQLTSAYEDALSNAESFQTMRNICYAISGTSVTFFAVSFVF